MSIQEYKKDFNDFRKSSANNYYMNLFFFAMKLFASGTAHPIKNIMLISFIEGALIAGQEEKVLGNTWGGNDCILRKTTMGAVNNAAINGALYCTLYLLTKFMFNATQDQNMANILAFIVINIAFYHSESKYIKDLRKTHSNIITTENKMFTNLNNQFKDIGLDKYGLSF